MTLIKKATRKDIRLLSRKLLTFLEDESSRVYKENVLQFGIPKEYARKAFMEEALLSEVTSRKAAFYLAVENQEIIGFAQTIQSGDDCSELDRIIVFPEFTRRGIGALLLSKALEDQRRRGMKSLIVVAGKEETQARRFYEKNGFKLIREATIEAPWGRKLDIVTYEFCLKRG